MVLFYIISILLSIFTYFLLRCIHAYNDSSDKLEFPLILSIAYFTVMFIPWANFIVSILIIIFSIIEYYKKNIGFDTDTRVGRFMNNLLRV